MSTAEIMIEAYVFNRGRTLSFLEGIEKLPDPQAALVWQPSPGRAHIGWQLMHIAVTEEIIATERLTSGGLPAWPDWCARFRGGSTPDGNVPAASEIRQALAQSREHLLAVVGEIGDDRLAEIPPAFAARQWSLREVLHLIGFHESHHQGQAHLTLNLFKNR